MAKYLFVINSFLAGGAERSLLELMPVLAERDIDPVVVTLYRREVGFEDEVRAGGWDVRQLGSGGWLGRIRELRKMIKAESPDLVYTSLFDADLVGRLAGVATRVPVVSNLANTAYDPARRSDPNVNTRRLALVQAADGFTARHFTDHFHAVSQAVSDSSVETLRIDPSNITVVYRGRDVSRLGEPSPERRAMSRGELALGADDEVIVTVGRQEDQKGHRVLIEAFAGVQEKRPKAVLLIVGREGHSTAELHGMVAELGLGASVRFLGHRDDVPDVLASADVFAFPSLYEGLGGAVIEAMALGLPIVASDIPALREVVKVGENAALVPPGDVSSLQSAVENLLSDSASMSRFGAESRKIFMSRFDGAVAARNLADLLENVASTGNSGQNRS